MPRHLAPVVVSGTLAVGDPPTLAGEGLALRPFAFSDADVVVAAFQDPVLRHWHRRSIDTAEEARAWIDEVGARWREESAVNWLIVDGERPVGRVGISRLDLDDGRGEIAYWVLAEERGRHLAARATRVVAAWAFGSVGLHRLELRHSTQNEPSCRVAAAAGFAAEGTARAALLHADGWHDLHLHARLATDPAPVVSS